MNIDKVRTLKIAWDRNMPKEIRNALQPIVEKWAYLLPTWCHFMKVLYNIEAEFISQMTAEPLYRRAFMMVGSGWLVLGHEGRIHSIVHELLHVPWEPVTETLEGILDEYIKCEATRKIIEREWRHRYEAAVEDLANALTGPRDY